MQQVVLTLADAPAHSAGLTPWLQAQLENIYGVAHPDPVAELAPFVEATYQAVIGTSVNPSYVDPAFGQQLRHTLNLDGRPPAGRPGGPPDVHWDIGHEWKLPPPRKPTRAAVTEPKTGGKGKANRPNQGRAKSRVKSKSPTRSTPPAKTTRLDKLATIVRAARARQQSRHSADDAADEGSE